METYLEALCQLSGNTFKNFKKAEFLLLLIYKVLFLDNVFITEKKKFLLHQYGIKVIYIPLSLFLVPSLNQLETIFSHIEKAEANILIHCKYGVDRTGISIAYWQIKKGILSLEEAVAEMIRHGFHKWYFWWIPILKKYLK